MTKLIRLWRRHKILTSAFLLAAALTVFFAVRAVMFTLYWSDPAHRDQAIQPWMTPGYAANSWALPREDMMDALGLAPGEGRSAGGKAQTLGQIAAARGVSFEALVAEIEAAVAAHRGAGE